MNTNIPDHVICKVTGVTHKIVCPNQNEEEFSDYLKDLLRRLKLKKMIYISIDCEVCFIGVKKHPLELIQIAECFDENLMKQIQKNEISINLKPGFMIRTPIRKDIIDLMSQVFTNEYLSLITFDFTPDIASMMDAGLKFNMKNIIDGQVSNPIEGEKNFVDTQFIGFKATCELAKKCVEYDAAHETFNEKYDADFNEIYCNTEEDKDPFLNVLNDEFWNYSSSDVALTAVALIGKFSKISPSMIKKASEAKVDAFIEIQKQYGILAPALMRKFSFIGNRITKEKVDSAKEGYKIMCLSDMILNNYELYKALFRAKKILSKIDINNAIERALTAIEG